MIFFRSGSYPASANVTEDYKDGGGVLVDFYQNRVCSYSDFFVPDILFHRMKLEYSRVDNLYMHLWSVELKAGKILVTLLV